MTIQKFPFLNAATAALALLSALSASGQESADLVKSLSTGRIVDHQGQSYTWRDEKIVKLVKGVALAPRGIDAIVDVAPAATIDLRFVGSPPSPEPSARLEALAEALAAPELLAASFEIQVVRKQPEQHASATGLDRDQAEAVVRYLIDKHKIAPERLRAGPPRYVANGDQSKDGITITRLISKE